MDAKDEWKDFYYLDKGEHWFGQNNRNVDNRWGYLTAFIFGNQNGIGQYHKNAYTKKKIEALLYKMNFKIIEITSTYYRENAKVLMLNCTAEKNLS